MKPKLFFSSLFLFCLIASSFSQVIIVPIGLIGAAAVQEHGFLPGKSFKFYSTLKKYDLDGKHYRVELIDERQTLKLKKALCSELDFTNTSEFSKPECIFLFGQYVDTLFRKSNAVADSRAKDTLRLSLQAIDARLLGFGVLRVHGICQVKVSGRGLTKSYCIDITDADEHSPISANAIVTRQTATRIMASASMREVIEQLIADLEIMK